MSNSNSGQANKSFQYYYDDLAPFKEAFGYTEEELVAAAQYNYDNTK